MKKVKTLTVSVIGLVVVAASLLAAAPAQAQCTLNITGISGSTGVFSVTGTGTNTITVTPLFNPWLSVVVGTTTNATVSISPFTVGSFTPVTITGTAVNVNQPSSFSVVASDTFHSITITTTVSCPQTVTGCTLTQGFWKTHPNSWPVSSLTLGTVTYTEAQLISILQTPVGGNGLIDLAHQLIAAKLNIANGASAPPDVTAAIAAADALIGSLVVPPVGSGFLSPSATSALTTTLDTYNNGLAPGGPSHCS